MGDNVSINIPVWGIAIIPLLIVFSVIIIILVTLNIKKTAQTSSGNNEGSQGWLGKKDILYWLLIICLGSIMVITYEYKNSQEVISHWSFAGTIVSIILALVAIGFTLFQTLSQNLSSGKIADSAEKIVTASNKLDTSELLQAGEVIKSTSKNIAEYNSKVEMKLKEMTDEISSMKTAHIESAATVSELFYTLESSQYENGQSVKPQTPIPDIDLEHFFVNVIPRIPNIPRLFVYSLFLLGIDTFKTKETRNEFLREFAFAEYERKLDPDSDVDPDKRNVKITQIHAAGVGSIASIISLVEHLGIYKEFDSKDISEKEKLLAMAEESILTGHKRFLDRFLDK